jgi:osmotically-inducible protein OsmY
MVAAIFRQNHYYMSNPTPRLSPVLKSSSVGDIIPFRPSLFDHKDEFIERVSPIGMAAIYFGSFSFAPQDAALSRQALFKLSFLYRYFLQPAGMRIVVQRQTAVLSGTRTSHSLGVMAEILARQIEGIEAVEDQTQLVSAENGSATFDAVQLLLATDQTLGSGVVVSYEHGKVILDGEISSIMQRNWAEQLVTSAGGDLESRLALIAAPLPNTAKAPDVDDESLQALVLLRLRLVRETERLVVRVKANRCVVTLQGKVHSEALRQRVENLARSTMGVRELRSSLTIVA